eukprot:5982707-Pleurochrysis_carterae.AAC.1
MVALSGCVGHARYGIPELDERSLSAPQVSMRRECNMGNCACGTNEQRAASASNYRVLAMRETGK